MNNNEIYLKKLKNIHDLMSWSKVIEITGCIASAIIFLGMIGFNYLYIRILFIISAFSCLAFTQSIALILKNKAFMLDTLIEMNKKIDDN